MKKLLFLLVITGLIPIFSLRMMGSQEQSVQEGAAPEEDEKEREELKPREIINISAADRELLQSPAELKELPK